MMNFKEGGDFYIPTTMLAEAQAAARMFTLKLRDTQTPLPNDIEGWEKIWAFREDYFKDMNREIVKTLGTSVKEIKMGGVPALDVRPKAWKDNRKAVIYTHGGGYTFNIAASTLIGSAPVADATGLRVISVDYTVAPKAKWREVTNQVSSVIKALVEEGYNIAIYGESASTKRGWRHSPKPPRDSALVLLPLTTVGAGQPGLFAEHDADMKRQGDDESVDEQAPRAESGRPTNSRQPGRNVHGVARVAVIAPLQGCHRWGAPDRFLTANISAESTAFTLNPPSGKWSTHASQQGN
jgi:hypothetical protein